MEKKGGKKIQFPSEGKAEKDKRPQGFDDCENLMLITIILRRR